MVTSPIADFPRRLRAALEARAAQAIDDDAARRARVAVIVTDEPEPAILFIQRLERGGDPWSGHAAFPGGYRNDPGETPDATARRETEEETGLVLPPDSFFGQLDDVYPRSPLLPPVVVTPCVYFLPAREPVRAAGEISQALWVPVSHIYDVSNRRPYTLTFPGGTKDFDSIHVAGLMIWGLTERILQQIATICS